MMDVTDLVKVEVERIKMRQDVGQTTNWIGGKGSGGVSGIGMASPSIDATVDSPGRWIANLGTGGNGGGGSEGDPTDGEGMFQGRGGRDDRNREFTLVNP